MPIIHTNALTPLRYSYVRAGMTGAVAHRRCNSLNLWHYSLSRADSAWRLLGAACSASALAGSSPPPPLARQQPAGHQGGGSMHLQARAGAADAKACLATFLRTWWLACHSTAEGLHRLQRVGNDADLAPPLVLSPPDAASGRWRYEPHYLHLATRSGRASGCVCLRIVVYR